MAVTVSPKEPAITNWNQSRFTSNSVVENEDYWQMLSRGEGSAYRRLVIMVLLDKLLRVKPRQFA